MPQATKQQLDAMAVADQLRPTLLRLGSELRRERIAGVSPHQVGLLVAIKYAPGVTVGELATKEHVSTAAMSKRVSRLERDGFVARTKSEADRRCVGLTLTDEGQRTLRRVRSRRTAWLASRLSALSQEELAAVGGAAEPLARLLEREEARA
jgi:DNA-binding MarR family transcriptional regulator